MKYTGLYFIMKTSMLIVIFFLSHTINPAHAVVSSSKQYLMTRILKIPSYQQLLSLVPRQVLRCWEKSCQQLVGILPNMC